VAPTINVALDRDDYIGLLPVTYRTIQGYGINFESLHYDCPALHPYRGVKSGLPLPANDGWELRYDPYRLQSIFVRDHFRGEWIEAEWTLARSCDCFQRRLCSGPGESAGIRVWECSH
jgi:putative transposase